MGYRTRLSESPETSRKTLRRSKVARKPAVVRRAYPGNTGLESMVYLSEAHNSIGLSLLLPSFFASFSAILPFIHLMDFWSFRSLRCIFSRVRAIRCRIINEELDARATAERWRACILLMLRLASVHLGLPADFRVALSDREAASAVQYLRVPDGIAWLCCACGSFVRDCPEECGRLLSCVLFCARHNEA